MGNIPYRLQSVPRKIDPAVVKALETLLAAAKDGRIIGLAYVALMPCHEYQGDLLGAALQHPVMALGLVRALEDQIARLIR